MMSKDETKDKKIKIEGEGYLTNKNLNKQFPVKFEVKQIHTGEISGKCTLSGFKYEDVLSPSQLEKCRCISGGLIKVIVYEMQEYILENFRDSSIEGETKNREKVVIDGIWLSRINFRGTTLDLKFSAEKVDVSYETISTKDQLWIKYGIINLDLRRLLRGSIETGIGKITFSTWKDHEEIIEEMETFKTSLLSGFLNITDVNMGKFESIDSYLKTADETIGKILELLSLAQSTYLSHCLISVYAKTPNSNSHDDYELKRMVILDIKTKTPSLGQPLIRDWEDIYKFIAPKTLRKYSDLREKFDLGIAFEWYLESLHGALQSDYLLACTCLELLKDRHNKKIGNEYIISPKELFDEQYYPDLKKKMKEVLKEKGINEDSVEHKNIRAEFYANLKGINRTSFSSNILRLLNDLNISYDDLFPNIKVIPEIRNQITHSGTQEGTPEELFDVYEKLVCLIQRIFLALLEYDGYFLDRNDRYERKKFTDFITDKSKSIRR